MYLNVENVIYFDNFGAGHILKQINPILFGVSGVAYFIWIVGGGQKCPTLAFSEQEMVWQWNLARIEATISQVKINCEFSKWRIVFDDVSNTLRNTVLNLPFLIYIIDGISVHYGCTLLMVFTSKHNMEITKSEKLLKKAKKKISGFFSIWCHPRKGVVQGFSNTYFQQFFWTAFKQSENHTLKISSQFSK